MKLRVVVVDDEPLARRRLKRLAAGAGAEVVGEAGDGPGAVEVIAAQAPDLVLLDVQMPGLDGFGVVARLPSPKPFVIFVTAFDSFALQAFEVHAVDYLLKPVSRDRLVEALSRARERLAARSPDRDGALAALVAAVRQRPSWIERLPVRLQGRVELVDVATIDWIEAADNYTVVHAGATTHVLRETLSALEAQLDPGMFARIHRSALVRIDRIVRLDSALRGDYAATLKDGTKLILSRTYRPRLERALGRRL